MAESLDISSNFISDMETGKRWLSSDTLVNLAKVLNVEAYELLRPSHLLTDDKQEFIRKYTERAVEITSDAVVSSLNKLYDLHLDDKL
ncbi:MAG: helix-turn-helix domain-containing protein [Treponema sp.]|nr:helix-turn-helix domain-containing protein [Treponema sp.]